MTHTEDIKIALTNYLLDPYSINIIEKALTEINSKIIMIDNEFFVKNDNMCVLLEKHPLMEHIKMLNNIQNGVFNSCSHNKKLGDIGVSCSGCMRDNNNIGKNLMINGYLCQSLLMRYMFEKIKLF